MSIIKSDGIIRKHGYYTRLQTIYGYVGISNMSTLSETEDISDNDYVLSPIYYSTKYGCDFQPGIVTGSVKCNECPINAAQREVNEELAIVIPQKNLEHVRTYTASNVTWNVYKVKIGVCTANNLTNEIESVLLDDTVKDDKTQKIIVILYGSLDEAMHMVEETRGCIRQEQDIIGTQIMNVSEIRRFSKLVYK